MDDQAPTDPQLGSARSQPRLEPGDLLGTRFRIVAFLARGGMGEVYEALDLELGDRVAVKTLRPELARDEGAMERLRRETQLARKVTHPNVCRTFDIGRGSLRDGSEVAFVSMELLAGETLAARLSREGRLEPQQALPIVEQMAAGLAAAHDAGVVHRDFKSNNVLLVPTEAGLRAVVSDFGLARSGSGEGADAALASGPLVGTAHYVAPEQVEGRPATAASDVYAFGVVLYEMVTGHRPFSGDSPLAIALQRVTTRPPPPRQRVPGLDPRWEGVILRCLEKDPQRRYPSIRDAVRALRGGRATPSGRRLGAMALAALALAGAGLAGWRLWSAAAPHREALRLRPTVAVLGFHSLLDRDESRWLATALPEMLSAELAASEQVKTISGDGVARLERDLALSRSAALAPDTLARVRARLGVDIVVSGSYLHAPNGQLRVDLRVQDAATGETRATLSDTATLAELLDLVSRTGARLRDRLGAGALSTTTAAAVRAALPGSPEAARLYAEGLARLRAFEPVAARDLFLKAVAEAPGAPLLHAALAEAWSAIGHDQKAEEAARRAHELSGALTREEKLWVEARFREMAREWDRAIETYKVLWGFFPDNLDYGLRLASAQAGGGKAKEALATVAALRALPPPLGTDPRVDLAEAECASAASDFKRQKAAALALARRAQESPHLLAHARYHEGLALTRLGELETAKAPAAEAVALFETAGDPGGAARALNVSAMVLWQQGELAPAIGLYERALAVGRQVGDVRRTAIYLNNIASVLSEQGDLDGARPRLEEALALDREVGNRPGEARDLGNLGDLHSSLGDLRAARTHLDAAVALARELGDRNLQAVFLANSALNLLAQGEVSEARARAAEALQSARAVDSKRWIAFALFCEGEVLCAQDELGAARERHAQALALRTERGAKAEAAVSRVALARLALAQGRSAEGEALAREAAEALGKAGAGGDGVRAQAVLASALLAADRAAEARAALEEARRLTRGRPPFDSRLRLEVASARVRAATGPADLGQARRRLAAAAAEARAAGWFALALEARLAALQLGADDPALAPDAAARGFRLVARQASVPRP